MSSSRKFTYHVLTDPDRQFVSCLDSPHTGAYDCYMTNSCIYCHKRFKSYTGLQNHYILKHQDGFEVDF